MTYELIVRYTDKGDCHVTYTNRESATFEFTAMMDDPDVISVHLRGGDERLFAAYNKSGLPL